MCVSVYVSVCNYACKGSTGVSVYERESVCVCVCVCVCACVRACVRVNLIILQIIFERKVCS